MRRFKLSELVPLTGPVYQREALWLQEAESGIDFLRHTAQSEDIVLFVSGPSCWIHGVLAPTRALTPAALEDAQQTNGPDVGDCWTIQRVFGGGKGHRMYLEAPLAGTSFNGGEKLVFRRTFHGYEVDGAQVELSQKLVHSLDLHFIEERSAYCRLDEHGELDDVIRLHHEPRSENGEPLHAVTIRRAELDKFMALSGTSLVFRFDFTRHPREGFFGFHQVEPYERQFAGACYHGGITPQASYCNGVFVVAPGVTRRQLIQTWKRNDDPKRKQYAEFIVENLRDGKTTTVSCSPAATANYFQASTLPLELSPAFFRPELLHKYKSDPDKYRLDDGSIHCRGTWSLRSYAVNEAGQVHAYLCDLRTLPFTEQLYWKSFNEPPKAPISDRTFRTDFLGQWDIATDPLLELRGLVSRLDVSGAAWWKPRGDRLRDAVHYPRTQSSKEWRDELLALDQLLVEGLIETPLRIWTSDLGREGVAKLRSVRLVQEVLTGLGQEAESARRALAPLARLHDLRNVVAGHATGTKRNQAIRDARGHPGGLPAHFMALLSECLEAMTMIESRLQ